MQPDTTPPPARDRLRLLDGGRANQPPTLPLRREPRRFPVIDCCPVCGCLHMDVEEFNACKSEWRR